MRLSSRSFSFARWFFRAASSRALADSTVARASFTAAWTASIARGSRARSPSSAPMRASSACRSISVRSWASTSSFPRAFPRPEPRWWAHLDSNQDQTGYEPGALPIELWAPSPSYRASRWLEPGSRLEEAPELLRPRRVPQLAERLRLDLTDALAGDREILADLLQRVLAAVGESEAQPEHLLLARRERVQHLVRLLPQREADHAFDGRADLLVLDEVAEVAVLLLADRRLEGNGLLGDLQHLAHLVDRHFHLDRDLFRRGLASQLLHELARGPDELVDGLDHVHGDADGAGLVGDRAGDGLANPPRGVGGELVAATVLELVHRLHESDVAFLDQIEELEPAVRVLLGDGNDEAEVGLHHLLLGPRRLDLAGPDVLDDALEVIGAGLRVLLRAPDLLLGDPHQPLLDGRMPRRRLLVEVAVAVLAVLGERVEEGVDLGGSGPLAVGPESDLAFGDEDLLHELLEVLTPLIQEGGLEAQGAESLKRLHLLTLGGDLVLLPRRLAPPLLAPPGLGAELTRLVEELFSLAQEPVDRAELSHHRAPEVGLLLLGEFLLRVVDQLLDGDQVLAELVAHGADLVEGERGGEDGPRRFVLALLDALGQGDLALAREEGHTTHLAEVEPHGIFRAADGPRSEIDAPRLSRLVVVGLGLGGLPGRLRGKTARLGRVHHLDVHGAEEHHDVIELIQRDDVRGQGVVDLVIGQIALFLPLGDELVQLLQLWFVRHARRLSWWGMLVQRPVTMPRIALA